MADLDKISENLVSENNSAFSGLQVPLTEPEKKNYGFLEHQNAIFQTFNTVSSGVHYAQSILDEPKVDDVPEENLYESLKGYDAYLDRFSDATSKQEIDNIKRRIDHEEQNASIMSEHGFMYNLAASVPAILGDPLNWIGEGVFRLPGLMEKAANASKVANSALEASRVAETANKTSELITGAARASVDLLPSQLALYGLSETQKPEDLATNYAIGVGLAGILHSIPYIRQEFKARGETVENTGDNLAAVVNLDKSLSAAMAGRTDEQLLKDMQLVNEKQLKATGQQWVDPLFQAQVSESGEARAAAAALNDTMLITRENVPQVDEQGNITDYGRERQISVQSIARGFIGAKEKASSITKENYLAYRAAKGQAALSVMTSGIEDLVKRNSIMSYNEFNEQVGRALRRGDSAADDVDDMAKQYISQSAKSYRELVYDPIFERAKKAGLIDEETVNQTSPSYLNRMWDVDKMLENRPGWTSKVIEYLNNRKDEFMASAPKIRQKIDTIYQTQQSDIQKISSIKQEIDDLVKESGGKPPKDGDMIKYQNMMYEMEDTLRYSEGPIPESYLKKYDLTREKLKKIENARKIRELENESKFLEKGLRSIAKELEEAHASMDVIHDVIAGDTTKLANEIFAKITKTGGRLSMGFATEIGVRGPALEKTLKISDLEMEDYLINSADHAAERYARTLGVDVAMAEKFGDVNMVSTLDKINQEYNNKIAKLNDPKKIKQLDNERKRVIKSLEGNRDRLRGLYSMPDRDNWYSDILYRSAHAAKTIQSLSKMGGTLVSSMTDPIFMIASYGIKSVFMDGIAPMVKGMNSIKLSSGELKLAGTALEIERSGVYGAVSEVWDGWGRNSVVEKALETSQRAFGFVSMISFWNQLMKNMAGTIIQNNVLRNVMKYESLGVKEITNLNRIGIGKDDAIAIRQEIKALEEDGHQMDVNGVLLARSKMWKNPDLQEKYRSAIGAEVDRVHVTPGGEKPLFLSTPIGSVIGQFKTFIFATQHRIMLLGLQRRDSEFMQGLMGMVGMGMLIYKLKKGDQTSDNPADWIKEGLDRGSVLGWMMEANNIASGFTAGKADIFRIMGTTRPVSRYQQRGKVGSLLGPTFGLANDISGVIGDVSRNEVNASTIHTLRTMMLMQNGFYTKGLFDLAEKNLAAYFGGIQ